MILVDSSLWVEVLRGHRSDATDRLRAAVAKDPASMATTEPIMMELLAGTTNELAYSRTSELLASLTLLRIDPQLDFENAATTFRAAKASGRTVRSLMDCLIASIAIRHSATLWHRDADYEVIAKVSPLSTLDLRSS